MDELQLREGGAHKDCMKTTEQGARKWNLETFPHREVLQVLRMEIVGRESEREGEER